MDIINNNPYRLLGVYANSPTKERVANEGKLKAFLKVNRKVAFPLDLPQFLPSVKRTIDTPANAEAKLTLPADQIKYAQFWFLNVTPVDKIAFRHLEGGDMDNAIATWDKATNASSLQNRIVCYLISKDYLSACNLAEVLYKRFASQFVSCVAGDNAKVSSSMAFDFLDTLSTEIGTSTLLDSVSDAEWKKHISAKAVSPVIAKLQSAVDAAKATRGKGSQARYNAGVKLMNGTKSDLAQLKALLPTTDLQYQMIADKLGLEILQCGIDYYNDSDEPDAARRAMVLQKYSLTVVVGKMAKDRCQENVKILKKIITSLPPQQIFAEDKAIKDELQRFSRLPDKISYAVMLLKNTKPHLQSIKRKLGESNTYYLKISTIVVGNALSNIIAEVNEAQNDPDIAVRLRFGLGLDYSQLNKIKSVMSAAWNATKLMDEFDMEDEFKSKRYNVNRSTLKEMCGSLGIPTYTPSPSSSYGSSYGSASGTSSKPTYRPSSSGSSRPTSQHSSSTSTSSGDDIPWGWIVVGIIMVVIFLILICS